MLTGVVFMDMSLILTEAGRKEYLGVAKAQLKKVVDRLEQFGVVTVYGGKGFIEEDWQSLLKEVE